MGKDRSKAREKWYSVCKSLHALTLGTDMSQSRALVPLQQVRRENNLLTTGCTQLVGMDLCEHFRCVPEELSWNAPGMWGGPQGQSLKRRRGLPVWESGKGMTGQLHSPDAASSPPSALVADMANILDWLPDRWQR